MHAWVRRAMCAAGLTGGVVLLGIGLAEAASADGNSGPVTSGESGIVSGNQTGVGVQAPVNASGNQVTVIGQDNHATSTGSASTPPASSGGSSSPTTTGQGGIGSGNQTGVDAQAPVNASGNQVTVIGQHNTVGGTGSSATSGPRVGSSGSPTTSGKDGIGSGNQTGVGVQAPVNVSGNQVTVIGQGNTDQSTSSTSTSSGGSGGTPVTSGEGGLLSGNQTGVGVLLPINLSGNQVTVIGQHNALGSTGSSTAGSAAGGGGTPSGSGPTTSGKNGIGSGNQTGIGVLLPINLSGNQVTVIGQDNTVSSAGGSTAGAGGTPSGSGPTTSGENGIGSGNQTGIPVVAPITATGNQVTVIGQDNTVSSSGGSTSGSTGGTTTGGTTTGAGGGGSGNQTSVPVQVPVDSSGNQVTVIGQGNTVTSTGGSTTGGTTPGSGTTSPPGGVVSPPTNGGSTGAPQGSTSQAVSAPVASGLPSTGLSGGVLGAGLLGLLLLLLGSALCRREGAAGHVA